MRSDNEDPPVIDPWMLDRFQEELAYLNQAAQAFGVEHPNAAGALRIARNEIHDPYVKYLLEGVAFLAARVRLKLDDEFPRFVEHMLDIIAPQLLATTPSMAVVAFVPDLKDATLIKGATIPVRTQLTASPAADANGQTPDCLFTTGREVRLAPLRVVSAEYVVRRAELERYAKPAGVSDFAAGLRLVFETPSWVNLASLSVDYLDVYLADERGGTGDQGKRLFDALCGRCVGGVIVAEGQDFRDGIPAPAPEAIGFSDPSLLVGKAVDTSGHRYLQEYFACPERFQFARLGGLGPALRAMDGNRFEVVYLLSREEPRLLNAVSAANVVLHAAPVINLFERDTRPMELSRSTPEHRVVVDGARPFAFEVVKLQSAQVWNGHTQPRRKAYPIYEVGTRADEWGAAPAFQLRRAISRPSADYRIAAGMTDSDYEGADLYVSFCGLDGVGPDDQEWTFASFRAWCCNRDHPLRIVQGHEIEERARRDRERQKRQVARREGQAVSEEVDDPPGVYEMQYDGAAPVKGLLIVRTPTAPRNPMRYMGHRAVGATRHTRGEWYWRALNHLSANYQSIVDAEDGHPDGLKEALAVYAFLNDAAAQQAIRAIRRVSDRAIVRRLKLEQPVPGRFDPEYARAYPVRGRLVTIVMDEDRLQGGGVFLLGGVLSRFLSEFASVNSFIELEIRNLSDERIGFWPALQGERRLA